MIQFPTIHRIMSFQNMKIALTSESFYNPNGAEQKSAH